MKRSILDMLRAEGYDTSNYNNDNFTVKQIDKLINNKYLGIKICNSKMVWVRKNGYKYNMKLTLCHDTNQIFIDRTRYVILGNELNLNFVANTIELFLLDKNNKFEDSSNKNYKNSNESENDPFSEKNIMRDLERGEGEKHGLD